MCFFLGSFIPDLVHLLKTKEEFLKKTLPVFKKPGVNE